MYNHGLKQMMRPSVSVSRARRRMMIKVDRAHARAAAAADADDHAAESGSEVAGRALLNLSSPSSPGGPPLPSPVVSGSSLIAAPPF